MHSAATDLDPQLANARAFWLGYGSEERVDEDISLYRSGMHSPSLNGILRVSEGKFDRACAEAGRLLKDVPWMWWVGPDSPADTADRLLEFGAAEIGQQPIMAARLDRIEMPEPATGLTVREVSGPSMLQEWTHALARVFGVSDEHLGARTELETVRTGAITRLVGFVDGRIVATISLFTEHAVAGLYSLTTAEGFRRRGIGAAMVAAAVREAREQSLDLLTLQSSAQGEPVYLRMGFQQIAAYRMFTVNVPR